MMLQRGPHSPIIWGYAHFDTKISTTLFNTTSSTQAKKVPWSSKFTWTLKLPPVFTDQLITIILTETIQNLTTKNTLTISNVLFGDIWVCSGQSNMQMPLGLTFNWSNEIVNAHKYTKMRLLTVELNSSSTPLCDITQYAQKWSIPSKETLINSKNPADSWSYFSATCWHFGKRLFENLNNNVPIGLIVSSWYGTNIEEWSSSETLKHCHSKTNDMDSILWNSMINPLIRFTIFGVIWYQGESNTNYQRDLYECIFPHMIDDWREKWHEGTLKSTNKNFPFGFVQIANRDVENASVGVYPVLRWRQTANYGYTPNSKLKNVFMATAVDLVDNYDDFVAMGQNITWLNTIHPRDKNEVGYRLSLGALNLAYENRSIEYYPPRVDSITYDMKVNNRFVTIRFTSEFGPVEIVARNKKGFEICCHRNSSYCELYRQYTWDQISDFSVYEGRFVRFDMPVNCSWVRMVRYAWRQKPCEYKQCALYSKSSGLPIYPFVHTNISRLNSCDVIHNRRFYVNIVYFVFVLMCFKHFNL